MRVLVVFENLVGAMLPQGSFKTLGNVIPWLLEPGSLALKVDDFNLFSLWVDVAVNRVISFVHDSLEIFVRRCVGIDPVRESRTFIRQIEDLRVDLGKKKRMELTHIVPHLLPTENQDSHIDKRFGQHGCNEGQLQTIAVQVGHLPDEPTVAMCLLAVPLVGGRQIKTTGREDFHILEAVAGKAEADTGYRHVFYRAEPPRFHAAKYGASPSP